MSHLSPSLAQVQGDLTASLLLCPPADCVQQGSCEAHLFSLKSITQCGIDTASASVGQSFSIDFVVYNQQVGDRRQASMR